MTEAKRASLQHRLKRRELWVSLWLTRLFAVLEQLCGEPRDGMLRDFVDRALAGLAKAVMCIFLCHAESRLTLRPARGFDDPRKCDNFSRRAAFGGALRRAFKAKSLSERLDKIRRALERREILIANLARRLRRGMTKLVFAYTRAAILRVIGASNDAPASTLCAPVIAGANTS